ncbi:HAD family hydrolase [Paenibacillus oralis]|uniref:HAD family hydrolase n=1 Tax=Paenibacillus oralis TaxID=2490856 RepID=A0A3P3U2B0_9BACL|nr:HAD family hydrolase [Paenibacillus oralis]RRJ64260.1 HAD family hydrolase [Paenibacillus oralis]
MPVIYIDLDGTLLDVWLRYYTVMDSFFERQSLPFPSFQKYKKQKRELVRDDAIIRHAVRDNPAAAEELISNYMLWKKDKLESESLLKLDQPIGRIRVFAAQLKPNYRLHLISVRRNHEHAVRQLQRLNMVAPFERIDLVPPSLSINPKWDSLRRLATPADLLIGDSEIDLQCGFMLGLRTFHVDTGLRSFEYANRNANLNSNRHNKAVPLHQYNDVLSYL